MQVTQLVLLTILASLSFPAIAALDCYFLAGFGQGQYTRSLTNKFEQRLIDQPYVEGTSTHQAKSNPYQIGGGCQPWRFLAIEVDRFQGFQTEVKTALKLCAGIDSRTFCSGSGLLRRRITLEGWEISALGVLPLSERVSLTARLGMLTGVAQVTVFLPQVSDQVGLSMEERGVIPVVGLGLMYRANRDFSLSLERKKFDGRSQTDQVLARWHF